MAAQHEAAGAATSEGSTASSFLREVAEVVVLAVVLYLGITLFIQPVHVEGLSMWPTLDDGNYLISGKIDYRLHAPQRGDIIILRPPTNNSTDFIKRIIALPGEKLLIRGGTVYIDGHRLHEESYLPEAWTVSVDWPCGGCDARTMGADQYFVMGDNRNRSQDSRFFGPVPRDRIDGKAWFRIWPFDHFGNIYEHTPWLETGQVSVGYKPGATTSAAASA